MSFLSGIHSSYRLVLYIPSKHERYGFQDAEIKSGSVLYSSVLAWNASLLFADMATQHNDTTLAAALRARAQKIQQSTNKQLWDEPQGVYLASTGIDSRNVDVWANAMAAAIGFAVRCSFSDGGLNLMMLLVNMPLLRRCRACAQWNSSRKFTLLPADPVNCVATLKDTSKQTSIFSFFKKHESEIFYEGHGARFSTGIYT
jgi:hypothetical protein